MSRIPDRTEAVNPFSTRHVRPGAFPFQFPAEHGADRFIERLAAHGWLGAIVGPHGSGKSALLATLAASIAELPRRVLRVELRDRQRRLPAEVRQALREDPPELIAVDGYEQLGQFSRARLAAFCRRRGCGLLVTSHAPVGLPEIHRMQVESDTVRRLVDQLQDGYPRHVVADDVAAALKRHGANVRELLFELYDLYETRRRGEMCGLGSL